MREEKRMCIKGCNVFRLCTKSIFKSFYTHKKELKRENNTKRKGEITEFLELFLEISAVEKKSFV